MMVMSGSSALNVFRVLKKPPASWDINHKQSDGEWLMVFIVLHDGS